MVRGVDKAGGGLGPGACPRPGGKAVGVVAVSPGWGRGPMPRRGLPLLLGARDVSPRPLAAWSCSWSLATAARPPTLTLFPGAGSEVEHAAVWTGLMIRRRGTPTPAGPGALARGCRPPVIAPCARPALPLALFARARGSREGPLRRLPSDPGIPGGLAGIKLIFSSHLWD